MVIGGNFTENITVITTYSYNLTTSGGFCGPGNESGTIVVNPGPRIELSPSSGSINQIRCEDDDIVDIVLNLVDGAINPVVSGLPDGVYSAYDSSTNQFTIYGNLNSSNFTDIHNYTVTVSGSSGGCSASIEGVLTISREDVLTPISNNPEQTICEGDAIDNINIGYSGGAIGVTISWWIDGIPTLGTPSGLMVNNLEEYYLFLEPLHLV